MEIRREMKDRSGSQPLILHDLYYSLSVSALLMCRTGEFCVGGSGCGRGRGGGAVMCPGGCH